MTTGPFFSRSLRRTMTPPTVPKLEIRAGFASLEGGSPRSRNAELGCLGLPLVECAFRKFNLDLLRSAAICDLRDIGRPHITSVRNAETVICPCPLDGGR